MGPYDYIVSRIDGDYAVLLRTDDGSGDEILVARALLPEAIDVGAALHYEMFTYSMPCRLWHSGVVYYTQFFRPLIWISRVLNPWENLVKIEVRANRFPVRPSFLR